MIGASEKVEAIVSFPASGVMSMSPSWSLARPGELKPKLRRTADGVKAENGELARLGLGDDTSLGENMSLGGRPSGEAADCGTAGEILKAFLSTGVRGEAVICIAN